MSKQLLDQELTSYESAHVLHWNAWEERETTMGPGKPVKGRDAFLQLLERSFENRNGIWTDRRGMRIPDIQSKIGELILTRVSVKNGGHFDNRPYVKNGKNLTSQYVAPWKVRSEASKKAHAEEMKKILSAEIKKSKMVFPDESVKNKIIEIIADDFVAQDDDQHGLLYHKVNSNGIISFQGLTFDNLVSKLGINKFTDPLRTNLEKQIYEAQVNAEATRIAQGLPGSKVDHARIQRTVADLMRADKVRIGKKLNVTTITGDIDDFRGINPHCGGIDLKTEFRRQWMAESGKGENQLSLEDQRHMERAAEFRLAEAVDISSTIQQVQSIQLPQPQSWEF